MKHKQTPANNWRDRLEQSQLALQKNGNKERNAAKPSTNDHFRSTSPGSTTRKAKKGHRPG